MGAAACAGAAGRCCTAAGLAAAERAACSCPGRAALGRKPKGSRGHCGSRPRAATAAAAAAVAEPAGPAAAAAAAGRAAGPAAAAAGVAGCAAGFGPAAAAAAGLGAAGAVAGAAAGLPGLAGLAAGPGFWAAAALRPACWQISASCCRSIAFSAVSRCTATVSLVLCWDSVAQRASSSAICCFLRCRDSWAFSRLRCMRACRARRRQVSETAAVVHTRVKASTSTFC